MKMRAGFQLWNKKPNTAPPVAAERSATFHAPPMHATMKLVSAAKSTTPAASPSSPSMRLTAFITPTNHKMVTGKPSTSMGRSPTSGRWSTLIVRPIPHAKHATAICKPSL